MIRERIAAIIAIAAVVWSTLFAQPVFAAGPDGDESISFNVWFVVGVLAIIALVIWIFFTVRRR